MVAMCGRTTALAEKSVFSTGGRSSETGNHLRENIYAINRAKKPSMAGNAALKRSMVVVQERAGEWRLVRPERTCAPWP